MNKNKYLFSFAGSLFLLGAFLVFNPNVAAAATITVDSTQDNIVDEGVCTLREAITSANNDLAPGSDPNECEDGSGDDTINFAISGTGVHTIALTSRLPDITDVVDINGYSESDANENTAVAPQPLNGNLVIEINGAGAGAGEYGFLFGGGAGGSAGSTIRGLVINRFGDDGIIVSAQDITIVGNYIGTDPTGLIDRGNTGAGISGNTGISQTERAIIGGTSPEHRNLLSGNGDSAAYPLTDWVIKGNYVGVDATGEVAMANSTINGSGAFSIDVCNGTIVGGTTPGSVNVISGNATYGIAPVDATNIKIQGNLIGTNWTGQLAIPNEFGIALGGDMTGSVVGGTTPEARNIISGNTITGIFGGPTGFPRIEGNYIGLNIDGDTPLSNGAGILLGGEEIIGGSVAARNVISGNTHVNVTIQSLISPSSGSEVSGNYIGTNANGDIDSAITAAQGEGVRISGFTSGNIIGGTVGNRIAGNRGSGVSVRSITITSISASRTPTDNAIIGNQIYGNIAGGPIAGALGLGIDIYQATKDTFTVPYDLVADTYTDLGINNNDVDDVDTGPNNFMNFPILNNATQDGNNLSVNLDLDAADSIVNNEYRVEFFANDTADPSGQGEGQTFLGFVNIANGDSQTANIVLPGGTDLTGKVLSATTTARSASTISGFGATSEFSPTENVNVLSVSSNSGGNLAKTGEMQPFILVLATVLMLTGIFATRRRLS